MDHRFPVQLPVVARRRQDVLLQLTGAVDRGQGLVGIAGEDDLVERFPLALGVFHHDAVRIAAHLPHGPAEVNLVAEAGS